MIPPSLLFKLVSFTGIVIAEGNKKAMHKLAKLTPGSFVGMGSPLSTLGARWGLPLVSATDLTTASPMLH